MKIIGNFPTKPEIFKSLSEGILAISRQVKLEEEGGHEVTFELLGDGEFKVYERPLYNPSGELLKLQKVPVLEIATVKFEDFKYRCVIFQEDIPLLQIHSTVSQFKSEFPDDYAPIRECNAAYTYLVHRWGQSHEIAVWEAIQKKVENLGHDLMGALLSIEHSIRDLNKALENNKLEEMPQAIARIEFKTTRLSEIIAEVLIPAEIYLPENTIKKGSLAWIWWE